MAYSSGNVENHPRQGGCRFPCQGWFHVLPKGHVMVRCNHLRSMWLSDVIIYEDLSIKPRIRMQVFWANVYVDVACNQLRLNNKNDNLLYFYYWKFVLIIYYKNHKKTTKFMVPSSNPEESPHISICYFWATYTFTRRLVFLPWLMKGWTVRDEGKVRR